MNEKQADRVPDAIEIINPLATLPSIARRAVSDFGKLPMTGGVVAGNGKIADRLIPPRFANTYKRHRATVPFSL